MMLRSPWMVAGGLFALAALSSACEDPIPQEHGCANEPEPPEPVADWCARLTPGPSGARSVAVDLSAAHAGVRFFSPLASYGEADQALALAIDAPGALADPELALYASALPGLVCSASANDAALDPASVELRGDVALVRPGTGPVALPAEARAVAIDLRGLPNVPELRAALETAVAPALASPVDRAAQRVRRHDGLVDEVFSANNVYGNSTATRLQGSLPATGSADLPLALLTGGALAPAAAELAATLRLSGRAWLVGEGVSVEVAEARWQGVGGAGLAWRSAELIVGDERWPDVVPADRRVENPECIVEELAELGAVPELEAGASERATIESIDSFGQTQPTELGLGAVRAALVVAHGAARAFYPYFPVVGDSIDERLDETLATLGEAVPDRAGARNLLRRFGNALSDGHMFAMDGSSSVAGVFPVYVEDIDDLPVIRRSTAEGVNPGDAITSIDGVPVADWYATELARSGGATDGYRFNIATREMLGLEGPAEFGLRDPTGVERTVTVNPAPFDDYVGVASERTSGDLGDLGAADLYYINLDTSVLANLAGFRMALDEAAQSATGLVLDMRGYPTVNHYDIAMRIVQEEFSSPIFRVPTYLGPDELSTSESSYPLSPETSPSFAGPVVLLVGHSTVSAAENFATMLVDAQRVTVVGRQSAGTNGNITGVQLPGGFGFSFTGMEVLHADVERSVFHGVGIVPDVEVALSASDFRDGIDAELLAAIEWLSAP